MEHHLPDWLSLLLAGFFGLLWGSFFNVCIWRMPRDQKIWDGRSKCSHCKTTIPWHHNLPILSFFWLRARCGTCRGAISWRYPLVEFSTALLYMALYWKFGTSLAFFAYAIFGSLLLIITFIDYDFQIIPDELSLGGLAAGLALSLFALPITWLESLAGILVGGGSFWLVATLYEKLTKREGLGGGDVKLLAMLGAWLGVQSILILVVVASGVGSVFGVAVMLIQKKDSKAAIPFGPFLALSALLYLFFSQNLHSYLTPGLE